MVVQETPSSIDFRLTHGQSTSPQSNAIATLSLTKKEMKQQDYLNQILKEGISEFNAKDSLECLRLAKQ